MCNVSSYQKARYIAYVIGPIRSKWRIVRWLNINSARLTAIKLWSAGFAVICPHMNSACMRHKVDEDRFIEGDLVLIEKCDFAVVVGKWENSVGSLAEIKLCRRLNMPVYHSVKEAIKYGSII